MRTPLFGNPTGMTLRNGEHITPKQRRRRINNLRIARKQYKPWQDIVQSVYPNYRKINGGPRSRTIYWIAQNTPFAWAAISDSCCKVALGNAQGHGKTVREAYEMAWRRKRELAHNPADLRRIIHRQAREIADLKARLSS